MRTRGGSRDGAAANLTVGKRGGEATAQLKNGLTAEKQLDRDEKQLGRDEKQFGRCEKQLDRDEKQLDR